MHSKQMPPQVVPGAEALPAQVTAVGEDACMLLHVADEISSVSEDHPTLGAREAAAAAGGGLQNQTSLGSAWFVYMFIWCYYFLRPGDAGAAQEN